MIDWRVYNGHVLELLDVLPSESVNCIVTSPPYWGLRDYGHEGQLGLEKTPGEYVEKMTEVFREARRVLRNEGTLWLNLGDSYAGSWGAQSREHAGKHSPNVSALHANQVKAAQIRESGTGSLARTPGNKNKDLVGIPWKVAFALQADGWYLRQDIIWHKPNPMPESVKDRCTKAHEYLFLLSKSEKYYFNWREMQEPAVEVSIKKFTDNGSDKQRGHWRRHAGFNGRYAEKLAAEGVPTTRNRRDVWTVATRPYKEAHFATFPPALIEPCIRAGAPVLGTVLDPFAGSGTTLEVAYRWARHSIGLELNSDYISMIDRRMQKAVSESLL